MSHPDTFAELAALREQVNGLQEALHGAEARAKHYADQVHYWKERAVKAEKRAAELQAQLTARNVAEHRHDGAIADLQTTVQGLTRRVELIEARHADHDDGLVDLARIPD